MTLEVKDLGGLVLPPVKTLPCRIQSLDKLARDVIKVVLRLPPSVDFSFLPGQYIDVIGQGGVRRSYSLANAHARNKLLELHIREVPGGALSEYWFSKAKVDDLLRFNGPLGVFSLRNAEGRDLVFLATGTGVAPVKSMLESIEALPQERRPRSVAVYWGARTLSDLYWDVESVAAAQRFTPVLSQAGAHWAGTRGYVQQALMNDEPDLSQATVYACGSPSMIRSAREVLVKAGLPETHFLSDAFVCSATI
jgi:CDP-4-dehydro-6-deoxyglucose reductase, E3